MQIHDRNVNVVEQFGMKVNGGARGEENNDFFLQIFLQECEEEQEAEVSGANDIALMQAG